MFSGNTSQINKLILRVLEDGDEYGLEIIKKIEKATNGKTVVKQPSLYSALSRMEKKGWISSFWRDSEIGGRRHYYSLTETGKRELKKIEVEKPVEAQPVIEEIHTEESKPQVIIIEKPVPVKEESKQVEQKPEPIIKTKAAFEQFDPNKSTSNLGKQSFTQQMRAYTEPEDLEEIVPPTPPKTNQEIIEKEYEPLQTNEKERIFENNIDDDVEIIQEHKVNKNEINYKDILGDLDADFRDNDKIEQESSLKSNFIQQAQTPQEPIKQERKQSEFSKQIAEILRSDKKTAQVEEKHVTDLYSQQNKSLMEEINRRYNLDKAPTTKTEQVHKIATNTVGYTHIKQDNITVKPYSKNDSYLDNVKNFVDKNKFNLCRAGVMTIVFFIELILSYFLLRDAGMIYEPHVFLYIFYGVLGFVYLGVMMMLCLKDLDKKVPVKNINWWLNLFYRVMFALIASTFVIAVCLCLGMTAPLDIEFFTLWYIPALMIVDLLISWVVGIIMHACKCFRV